MLKRIILKIINISGYALLKKEDLKKNTLPTDIAGNKEFLEIYEQCKKYTMTSVERMYSLYQAVLYIVSNNIEGDFVECGVWRGGSAMLMAMALRKFGDKKRVLYLYDTYEGMSKPDEKDINIKGRKADELLKRQSKDDKKSIWCYSPLEEVKENMKRTSYPIDRIKFIKGKVENTISAKTFGNISLLRLDTDWYESTFHELKYLYPLLVKNGILIIDDYGHWQGARKAVDKYFKNKNFKPLLARIDYTGRLVVKSDV